MSLRAVTSVPVSLISTVMELAEVLVHAITSPDMTAPNHPG